MSNFPFKRLINITVTLIFLFSDFALGATNRSLFQNKKVNYEKIMEQNESIVGKKKALQEGDEAKLQNSKLQTSQKIDIASVKDISDIHIPEALGKISEVYNAPGENARRIIHFQDLHTQYDAQKNSAKIIEHLYKTYNIDLVLSEGAFGKVEPGIIKKQVTDKLICERLSKLLLKTGEITGEEYLGIIKDYPIAIWGVENKDLYYRNAGQFNKLIKYSENAQVFLNQVEQAIKALKPVVYNKGIKELEEKEVLYEDKKLDLNAYLDYLTQIAKKLNLDIATLCPNITLLQKSLELEKTLQLTNVTEEARLYNILLTQELTTKGKTKELDEFSTKTALFQQEKISSNKFYMYLKELGQKLNLPLTNYKNLSGFTDYLGIIAKMESYKIYTELQTLLEDLRYKSCDNEGQKNLLTISKNTAFLKDFFNLKISNEEIENFLANKDKYTVSYFKQVITGLKGKTGSTGQTNFIDYNPDIIDNHFQELVGFYNIVWQRDEAIVANTLKRMDDAKESNSILIVGGFHTKGMMKMFRDKGISYVVLSANSGKEMDDELYHSLLAGKNWTLNEIIPLANEITKESLRTELPTDTANPEAFIRLQKMLPLFITVVGITFGKDPNSTVADLINTTGRIYTPVFTTYSVTQQGVIDALSTVDNIAVKKSKGLTYVALGKLGYFRVNEKGIAEVITKSEFDNIEASVEVAENITIPSGGDKKPMDDGSLVPEYLAGPQHNAQTLQKSLEGELANVPEFLNEGEKIDSIEVTRVADPRPGETMDNSLKELMPTLVAMTVSAACKLVTTKVEIDGHQIPLMGAAKGREKDKDFVAKIKDIIDGLAEESHTGILSASSDRFTNLGIKVVDVGTEGTVSKTVRGEEELATVSENVIGAVYGEGAKEIDLMKDPIDGTTQTATRTSDQTDSDSISLTYLGSCKSIIPDGRIIGIVAPIQTQGVEVSYNRQAPIGTDDPVSWNLLQNINNIRQALGKEWKDLKIALGAKLLDPNKPSRWTNFVNLFVASGGKIDNITLTNLYEIGGSELVLEGKADIAISAVPVEMLIASQMQRGGMKLTSWMAYGTKKGLDSSVPNLNGAFAFKGAEEGKEDEMDEDLKELKKFNPDISPGHKKVYTSQDFISKPGMVNYSGINGLRFSGVEGVKIENGIVKVTVRIHDSIGGVYDVKLGIKLAPETQEEVFEGSPAVVADENPGNLIRTEEPTYTDSKRAIDSTRQFGGNRTGL